MIYYLYKELIEKIKNSEGKINLSFDLGLTFKDYDAQKLRKRLKNVINKIKGRVIHVYDEKKLFKLAIYSNHYYALVMKKRFPILEIDGIQMHVFANNPFEYARKVIQNFNIKNKYILETCFGQGYITRLLKDAKKVISYEISSEVLDICKWNPYSKHLFNKLNVEIKHGDIFVEIPHIKHKFDILIHDPPTIRIAERLYSLKFYEELYKAAKPNAVLYHYIGNPFKKRNSPFKKRIIKKLSEVGWKLIEDLKDINGLILIKE